MAKNITQYDLLISCPGDIQAEIDIINIVVEKFNKTYSDVLGLRVRTKHWASDSYAQSGGKPQDLLNKQFVYACDAAVALLWTRFGTPTDKYGSGTEEEIESMLEASKQVFMYFSQKPVSPEIILSDVQREQYQKVLNFKNRYQNIGTYFSYATDDQLEELFFAHLSMHFLSEKKSEEMLSKLQPNIVIKSVTDSGLTNNIFTTPFNPSEFLPVDTSDLLEEIKNMFEDISNIELEKLSSMQATLQNIGAAFYKDAEIKESMKSLVTDVASHLDIDLANDFFALGSLRYSVIGDVSFLGSGRNYAGSENELAKYNLIVSLYDKITDFLNWSPLEKICAGFICIKLVVENNGTTYDEDIDITLKFKADMFIPHGNLPIPEEDTVDFIYREHSLKDIFGIFRTSEYNDFKSSKRLLHSRYVAQPSLPVGLMLNYPKDDYEEKYLENLDEVFEYQIFYEEEWVVIKLHIDYLKHNSAVAFPTVLFTTDKISDIEYTVSSKHNDKLTNGKLSS